MVTGRYGGRDQGGLLTQQVERRRPLRLAAYLPLCAALVTLAGCAGTAAYLTAVDYADIAANLKYRQDTVLTDYHQALRELAAQRRTMDRLLATYRDCLVTGEIEALCWADLAGYLDCLEAGSSDAVCRTDAP